MKHSKRNERELETIWTLETSVARIASQFKGERAFNYSHEIEIAAHLMNLVRDLTDSTESVANNLIHLTRMEWRCINNRDIDLVIIHPNAAKLAREHWGTIRSKAAKILPLLCAIQLKRGGGAVTPLGDVKKDLRDLDYVYNSETLEQPVCYFLDWIDSSLRRRPKQMNDYRIIKNELEAWCKESPETRRALILSRDRIGCVFPLGAWLVGPLPVGVEDGM